MSWQAYLVLKMGELNYKKCEDNVKLKDMDSHADGASLMQISAILLEKLKYAT